MKGRKRNRLKGYDYSSEGMYFVTICTQDKEKWFGKIEDGKIILNEIGGIALKHWQEIPLFYPNVKIDFSVIMPNHLHGIIIIKPNGNSVGTGQCPVPTKTNVEINHYGLLSKIINAYKNIVTKTIRRQFGNRTFKWQRSFYDHIIRDEKSFYYVQEYILNNPSKWPMDVENPENKDADLKNYYDKIYDKTNPVGTGQCPVPTISRGGFENHPGFNMKSNGSYEIGVITQYPVSLRGCLKDRAPEIVSALGNLDILAHKKTAFFCSSKCPGELILKAYDLARELRDEGVTVIGGFHSPMEKECLRILLRGKQPLIVCLAKQLVKRHLPVEFQRSIDDNRLVLISPFTDKVKRVTAETAQFRNEFVAAFADAVFVVHAAPGSKTEEFCRKMIGWGKPLYTFDSPENANLMAMGARIYEGGRRKNEEGRTFGI